MDLTKKYGLISKPTCKKIKFIRNVTLDKNINESAYQKRESLNNKKLFWYFLIKLAFT